MNSNEWTDLTIKAFKGSQEKALELQVSAVSPVHFVLAIAAKPDIIAQSAMSRTDGNNGVCLHARGASKAPPHPLPAHLDVGLGPEAAQILMSEIDWWKHGGDVYLSADHVVVELVEEKDVVSTPGEAGAN